MTSTTSARLSATWPAAASTSEANSPVTLTASAPLAAAKMMSESFRVMSAFAFGKRVSRQSSADMCALMDRMN